MNQDWHQAENVDATEMKRTTLTKRRSHRTGPSFQRQRAV
jgi:hypothetical protein